MAIPASRWDEHPRVGNAISLVSALGGWLTSMFATTSPVIFWIGFTGSVTAIGGLLLRYGGYFWARITSAPRTPDRPSLLELLIAAGVICGGALLVVIAFRQPDIGTPKAIMAFDRVVPRILPPGIPIGFDVTLKNTGALAARGQTYAYDVGVNVGALSSDGADQIIWNLQQTQIKPLWATRSSSNEIQPGVSRTFPVQLLRPMTQEAYDAFLKSERRVYLFFILAYDDETTPDQKYRMSEICVYFVGTFTKWNGCDYHNGPVILSN